MNPRTTRIGIIGSGAIGGFYGLMLARAGFDVHFCCAANTPRCVSRAQARQCRARPVADAGTGLRQRSQHAALRLAAGGRQGHQQRRTGAVDRAGGSAGCEGSAVAKRPGCRRAVAPGLAWRHAPAGRPVLHLCPSTGPGDIRHQALGAVNLGYHSGPAADGGAAVVEEGAGLFRAAGIDSQAMANLEQARWQKLVWNVPYNGLSVLLQASTTPLMADPDSRVLVQALMAEVVEGPGLWPGATRWVR